MVVILPGLLLQLLVLMVQEVAVVVAQLVELLLLEVME
jgi:hypothetical protein